MVQILTISEGIVRNRQKITYLPILSLGKAAPALVLQDFLDLFVIYRSFRVNCRGEKFPWVHELIPGPHGCGINRVQTLLISYSSSRFYVSRDLRQPRCSNLNSLVLSIFFDYLFSRSPYELAIPSTTLYFSSCFLSIVLPSRLP